MQPSNERAACGDCEPFPVEKRGASLVSGSVQRWRDHRDSYRPAGEVIDTRAHEVALIPDDNTAKAFVTAHHYSGSYPAARYRVGLYEHSELVGVAVFSHPSNPLALRPLPVGLESTELGRFVLLDRVRGNGETWFLARAFELLRREGIVGVVSFSDPFPRVTAAGHTVFGGHVGTIYQAFNGVYLGRSRSDTMRLFPDGRTLHNRALAKLRGRECGWRYVVESLVGHGAAPPSDDEDIEAWIAEWVPRTRKARHPGNHKYAWALEARAQRQLRATLTKPYPKLGNIARAT